MPRRPPWLSLLARVSVQWFRLTAAPPHWRSSRPRRPTGQAPHNCKPRLSSSRPQQTVTAGKKIAAATKLGHGPRGGLGLMVVVLIVLLVIGKI